MSMQGSAEISPGIADAMADTEAEAKATMEQYKAKAQEMKASGEISNSLSRSLGINM